jgi:hypothetical protein
MQIEELRGVSPELGPQHCFCKVVIPIDLDSTITNNVLILKTLTQFSWATFQLVPKLGPKDVTERISAPDEALRWWQE